MKTTILGLCLQAFATSISLAQVAPGEETNRLVGDVATAFFHQLTKHDFAAERAFMTDDLAAMASLEDWTALRQRTIGLTGPTPAFRAHAVTFYQQSSLLAAVDFWGQASKPGIHICGFLLWEIPEPNLIGLGRMEQNVVETAIVKSIPVEQAVQMMMGFHCPGELIEQVLGVTVKANN